MFEHMQTLPIRYFDTNTHGDLMSHFTNDTDTLQQMLSQSVPQMFSSAMTIISVLIGMIVTNIWLTIFVLLGVAVMLVVVKNIGGKSARYFLAQQTSLGKVTATSRKCATARRSSRYSATRTSARSSLTS